MTIRLKEISFNLLPVIKLWVLKNIFIILLIVQFKLTLI